VTIEKSLHDQPRVVDCDGTRRVECACGAHLRTFSLPFGTERGTFRARCRECHVQWAIPLRTVLAGADPARASTLQLSHHTNGAG
jgi:hypothetical protein